MAVAETQREFLKSIGVLVKQVAEVCGGRMCVGYGKKHAFRLTDWIQANMDPRTASWFTLFIGFQMVVDETAKKTDASAKHAHDSVNRNFTELTGYGVNVQVALRPHWLVLDSKLVGTGLRLEVTTTGRCTRN